MGLREYIIRRIIMIIPIIIGAVILIFAVVQLIPPGSRALLYVRTERDLQFLDQIIKAHKLDASPVEQFADWLRQILEGNFGWTRVGRGPVLNVMFAKWPATIEIVMFAAPLTIIFGIILGVISAVHRDKLPDHITRLISIAGYSLPSFWLGLILLSLTYITTGTVITGRVSNSVVNIVKSQAWHTYTGLYTIDGIINGRFDVVLDALKHLALPVIVITTINMAGIIRLMRSSMLEALTKNYIITAKAKGLKNTKVINKHARRNALIPVVTIAGLMVASMLSGLIITETVFAFEGVGQWAAQCATQLDIAGVIGFTIFTGLLFVISNLIVDILYAYIDPRIRLG